MERDLGYRKIQRTGRGSYIISLPKNWVENNGLERGNELLFKVQNDSSLLLESQKMRNGRTASEPELKVYSILVNRKEDPQFVCRKIRSLYVVSTDLIHIRFKEEVDVQKHKSVIRDLVRNKLLGSEIIDETNNEITLQILITHPDFPIEKAIRRMAILALLANRDAILALKSEERGLIQGVIDGYNDANRLGLYIIRQLKFGIMHGLFKEFGFRTSKDFLGYRIIVNNLKGIAYNALNIVNNIMIFNKLIDDQILFIKYPLDDDVYPQILDFNSSVHQLFEESLKAWFKGDYEYADKIISKLESLVTVGNDLIILIYSKRLNPNISSIFRLIIDNSSRIVEYIRDIVEVTLNSTIEEILQTPF